MVNYFTQTIQNYANFSGRSRRKEFWLFVLATMLIDAFLNRFYGPQNLVTQAAGILLLIPMVALAVRRLHDQGHAGWWLTIALSGIGLIPLFFMMMVPGHEGPNQYGEDPKANDPYDTGNYTAPRRNAANEWYHEDVLPKYQEPVREPRYRQQDNDLV